IKEYAEQTGETVDQVVITVPAYFNLAQRAATIQAGEAAGLNVLATINEPTAAALSYCAGSMNQDQTVLVYDLGGGTFDVTLLQMTANADGTCDAKVLVTAGDAMLGGTDWDWRMIDLLKQKYAEQTGMDVSEMDQEVINLISGMAEKAKQDLTEMNEATVKFRFSGERIKLVVTREEFDAATVDLLQRTVVLMDGVLQNAASQRGIGEDQVDLVLEVGGSTRMRQVQEMLHSRFSRKTQFYEPEKAVAMGAAIAADMLSKGVDIKKYNQFIEKLNPENMEVKITDAGKVQITNKVTGETATVDKTAMPEDIQEQIEKGEAPSAETLITGGLLEESGPRGSVKISDVAPSTFGVIVRKADGSGHISDNLIKKDSETPCAASRTYRVPEGASRLVLPVTESQSLDETDEAWKAEDHSYSFPDATKDMSVKAKLEMNVPPDLPPHTLVEVTVSFDEYANLHVVMTVPSIGEQKELDVNFSPVSQEEAAAMSGKIDTIAFIDDI
ncbi:MAG: Hsp70 family protein, partial [Oscillibacter sp.]|nr:Hsp70 family protein [Oscillibacter sp.]